MKQPILCHLLVGPPGSGKSTIAEQWCEREPDKVWVSTDRVRERLYGDAAIQGTWAEVESVVQQEIRAAIEAGRSVIYDATNVRRAWRMGLLQQVNGENWLFDETPAAQWMAWRVETSLATCLRRNKSRDRQVPREVVERFYDWMQGEDVRRSEGFVAVNAVPLKGRQVKWSEMEVLIEQVPTQIKQRRNRYRSLEQHPFSNELAFERLIMLISVLVRSPGISDLEEIAKQITEQYGGIYAESKSLEWNLNWLMGNGLVNSGYTTKPFELGIASEVPSVVGEFAHGYSDRSAFVRLLETVRFLVHHPVMSVGYGGVKIRDRLLEALRNHGITGYSGDAIRRDIQLVLKPYGIMSDQDLRRGYFIGTGVLSGDELLQLYQRLAGQAAELSDPIALTMVEQFQQRLQLLSLGTFEAMPIQRVVNQPIVNPKYLSPRSLAQPEHSARLEQAIRMRQVVRLQRIFGTGRFPQDRESSVAVIPLQVVFYNIAWYLGYQRLDNFLFQFERLDRLSAEFLDETVDLDLWQRSYKDLEQLRAASYGLFFGVQARDQQDFLSTDGERRSQVEERLELWFEDGIFKFVSEGTQRFAKFEMSPRQADMGALERRELFTLEQTGDERFPHRLVAIVPKWSVEGSVDLMTWILGFGAQVRVVAPVGLRDRLSVRVKEMAALYGESGDSPVGVGRSLKP